MRLSKHFTLDELCKSETAIRRNLDNTPDDNVKERLTRLVENILEPVRVKYNTPFSPSSGFRSPEVNEAVGSKPSSQHIKGQAVDFEINGVSNYDLACYIRDNLDYDQLILEFYEPGKPMSGWVHCSYNNPEENRNQCLTINKYGRKLELTP